MKAIRFVFTRFMIISFCLCFSTFLHAENLTPSPVGYWQTIDDVTGKPKATLHIYQTNAALYGQIVKIYPDPNHPQSEICTKCLGSLHNQRILGMIVMKDLKQDTKNLMEWSGGHIVDPSNGKVYRCALQINKNGQRLNVRGYIGISLFGRSQTWLRIYE